MEDMHKLFMKMALEQAEQALAVGEVPVGAVIAHQGRVIAASHNQREQLKDPTAHAEMIAITQAAESMEGWRLVDCALYVTLEPCPMCAGGDSKCSCSESDLWRIGPQGRGSCQRIQNAG